MARLDIVKPLDIPSNGLWVEDVQFSPTVASPRSLKNLIFAGAGVRGVHVNPELFLKVTCLGFYVEEEAINYLADKWSGKTSEELACNEDFYSDVIAAPFEKFMRVAMLLPLTGSQFAEKILANTRDELEAGGMMGEEEKQAMKDFEEHLHDQNFLPGTGPVFVFSSTGLAVAFADGDNIPDAPSAVMGNKRFAEAMLSTMIGKNGVSPAAKASIAKQISSALTPLPPTSAAADAAVAPVAAVQMNGGISVSS